VSEATPAQTTDLGGRAVLNTAFVLGARILSRLAALVLVIVLFNHLGAARYGQYTTLVAYSAIVSVLADFGLNTLYTREAARARDALPRYLGTLLAGKLPLAALAFLVLGIAANLAGIGSLVLPGIALLGVTTYSNLLRNTFYAVGRLEFEAVAVLGETAIQGAGIVYGATHGAGIAYFLLVYAASYGFTCAYCLAVIPLFRLAQGRPQVDPGLLPGFLKLAFPFALGSFLTNVYFKVDVPILAHFRAAAEVGWYQAAYKPFEALQFIPLAVQSVVYPLLAVYFRSAHDRLDRAYHEFFRILVLLGWPLSVGTFVLTHPIGRLFHLFPESYVSLRILALAITFLFVNSAFTAMLYSVDRQDLFAWTTAAAVVVNVALNLVLIPRWGYLAASADTVVTEAAFSVVAFWFLRRTRPLPWLRLSWRILLAGIPLAAVAYELSDHSLLVAAPVAGLAYLVALWLFRAVTRDDVRLLRAGLRLRR
jgi:O-antigen/teichoic acid export membrane protein